MFTNRVFLTTFLISAAAHVVILSQSPNFRSFLSGKARQNLEVRYVKAVAEPPAAKNAPGQRKMEPFLKLTQKIGTQKRNPPPFIDKDIFINKVGGKALADAGLTKPAVVKPDMMAITKKVTLPPIDLNKISNPSYISYYQIVREKIRRSAYYNYTHSETGEVYVSFAVSSDGSLNETRLIEEKSSDNNYLREVALRSVKDASPFPAFPKELDYPTLSFNVVISFEIE